MGGVVVRSVEGRAPVEVTGPLVPGHYALGGQVSSQFASSALCALACVDGESELRVRPVLSEPYLQMTLDMLSALARTFRVVKPLTTFTTEYGLRRFGVGEWIVEGDWSTAAFPAAAGLLSDRVCDVVGLNPESRQGDRYWMKLLDDWGSEFRWVGSDS